MTRHWTSGQSPSSTRRGFLVGASALGAGAAASLWSEQAGAQGKRPLTYGLSAYPPNLRPFEHGGAAARTVKSMLHRGLLSFGHDGNVQPEVAESYETPDPRTYVFKLRDNAVFQNGEPVTAQDVKFSLDQIVAPNSTAYFREDFRILESVEALSEKSVKITLKLPTPSFLPMLAGAYAPVVSAKSAAANPNSPVGVGPYVLVDSEKGVGLTFKANPRFYKPDQPKSESLRFVVYADDSLRVAALTAGDVDIIEYVPWQSMKTIEANPNLVLQSDVAAYMYLVFNMTTGPFKDARIRRAVAHGIRRDDIIKAAFLGFGEAIDGLPIEPGSPYFDPAREHLWPYDPDRAKALLKEAGAQNVKATLLSTATYGMHKDTSEVIQQNLAAIGMQIELNLPEWGVRVSQGNQGRYQFAINGGGAEFGDPDELTGLIGSGSASYRRSFGLNDKRIDDLLTRGRHEPDQQKRRAIYSDLSAVAQEEVPVCLLNHRIQSYGLRKEVKGFQSLPRHLLLQSGISLDTAYVG
jgi:peptide/nickel transport system substrate-binding protein